MIRIFTIGFTKKTAEQFFTTLSESGVKRIIDVRLNNTSQLAGWSKKDDLRFFLDRLCGIDYVHQPLLAPTQQLMDAYMKHNGPWAAYVEGFHALLSARQEQIARQIGKELMDGACLLCSEAEPEHCHRRLVAEYLRSQWPDVEITHIR